MKDAAVTNPTKTFRQKAGNCFAQCPRMIEKTKSFSKKVFSPQNVSMDTWNAVLRTPTKIFRQRARKTSSMSENDRKS